MSESISIESFDDNLLRDTSLIEAREVVTIRCLSAILSDLEQMVAETEAEERGLYL